ncbi:MAG: alpha/beta hydrolase [Tepidiformaceae bacterium]
MPSPRPATIPGAHEYVLHSPTIGTDFLISVSEPRRAHVGGPLLPPDPAARKRPVLYVLDGNSFFPTVQTIARQLQSGGDMPGTLVVGIGYDNIDLPWDAMQLRMRELTPTAGPIATLGEAANFPSEVGPLEGGGTPAFLDFIVETVKPFIESTYAADATDSTLVGYSLGGLFVLYTLFHRSAAFQRYLAGSPSIWWDDVIGKRYEEEYAAAHDDLAARVFMSVGSREEEPEGTKDARMVGNMRELAATLAARQYPNLTFASHVFDGESHDSSMFAAFARGLRVLFEQ